jgi:hypothetical protein
VKVETFEASKSSKSGKKAQNLRRRSTTSHQISCKEKIWTIESMSRHSGESAGGRTDLNRQIWACGPTTVGSGGRCTRVKPFNNAQEGGICEVPSPDIIKVVYRRRTCGQQINISLIRRVERSRDRFVRIAKRELAKSFQLLDLG